MTKTEISHSFRELTRINRLVYTFNSNRKMRGACQGFVDHVIVDRQNLIVWFVEVKIGKDKLNVIQEILKTALQTIESMTRYVRYRIVNESNCDRIIDEIVTGK